jgi:polyribonucleotide nucleotidyltransferase
MIRKIIEDSGVTSIDIEDDGRVVIGSVNGASAQKAEEMIRDLTGEVEIGRNYKGKVVRIMPFGAFVQITPNQDGLVHISQLAEERVNRVEDAVNVGDEIEVKVTEIDRQGRVNLSRKAVLEEAKGITNGDWIVTDRDRARPLGGGGGGHRDRGGERGRPREFDRAGGRERRR